MQETICVCFKHFIFLFRAQYFNFIRINYPKFSGRFWIWAAEIKDFKSSIFQIWILHQDFFHKSHEQL
ncbi:hypothetical protein KL86PLE_70107 [uncultured Pleomorphomonas sp.]|uniref:Uncharacterized protein n=1 Tax=uncultured Pleomorphomonas sp. TaxID=442121 RepID=A0A212LLC9_9HYPH|nr:hypothetical protein KL86PLE_70107 [uncultured Pleomorphomonas sp.]